MSGLPLPYEELPLAEQIRQRRNKNTSKFGVETSKKHMQQLQMRDKKLQEKKHEKELQLER